MEDVFVCAGRGPDHQVVGKGKSLRACEFAAENVPSFIPSFLDFIYSFHLIHVISFRFISCHVMSFQFISFHFIFICR